MSEQTIGAIVDCAECGGLVFTTGLDGHRAMHRRLAAVQAIALESSRRGAHFQPGARIAFQHGPRGRARIDARRRAAR